MFREIMYSLKLHVLSSAVPIYWRTIYIRSASFAQLSIHQMLIFSGLKTKEPPKES